MRLPRVLRTTTFRLAALYVAGFAAAVALLGVAVYLLTAGLLERRLEARVANEASQLAAIFRSDGIAALAAAVERHERARPNGVLGYAVVSNGQRIVGNVLTWPATPGWSDMHNAESGGEDGSRRFLVTDLSGSVRLVVAADLEEVEEIEDTIFNSFVSAFGAVLILGIGGGLGFSFLLLRRVETIRRTAQAIIAGDLAQRVPIRNTDDDFDRLSQTLNQMLDRIGELMTSLRAVSANIAHDLKTPLARLRQRLEAAQARPSGPDRQALDDAVAQVDNILATFEALLRIAQIEAGTRRAGFARVDLSDIFATIADAFAPAAEDAGQTLTATITPNIAFTGDRELITQMLANTVDNAIRHTGPGTHIAIDLRRDGTEIVGCVSDDGPGVPAEEQGRIFERFRRLPGSREVPGSGLGLSLVKAVADIHGIALAVEDAKPGLRLVMRFPGDATH